MIASGGILCLDEVSELDKSEFKYLNEAMEDGEAHITKGGLNITVKTRASLLAACNPIEGSFDSYQPLAEQVKIPESTLSRFDLKILLQDISEEGKDRRMIEHITTSHMDTQDQFNFISPELLRKYIAYGRKLKPKLTSKSKKVIDEYYVSIRKEVGGEKMKVTPRQGTAVIRLAEAHARMRLSDEVSTADAEAARDLFDMCFRNVATDPVTGKLDISRVDHRHKSGIIETLLRVIRSGTDNKSSETEIISEMSKHNVDAERVLKLIRDLKNEGKLMEPRNGIYKVV
jgi:replicative DNA helicase Mcm